MVYKPHQVKSWPGKTVICVDPAKERNPSRTRQLTKGATYKVKSVSVGNHDAFVRLEGFPETVYSEFSRRDVPNSFNAEAFELKGEEER